MELFQQGEMWAPQDDGSVEFAFTKYIIKGPSYQYFYADSEKKMKPSPSLADIEGLDLVPISVQDSWPLFSDQFSRGPDLSPSKY